MRIIADENIPFAREAFSPFGEVTLLPGRSITTADLKDADALLVRSVTTVGRSLLAGTAIRFVGTATIGVDHIDTWYLVEEGIGFSDAAGSNSRSVAEYVLAALLQLRARGITAIEDARFGIVGAGRIGTRVAAMMQTLGISPVLYDPPRARRDGFLSASLEELQSCSIITLHVPLVRDGDDPTQHLVDRHFLDSLPAGATVINTSRGDVVDSEALLGWLRADRSRSAVLDVWEGEPDIPTELVDELQIATPHIAGYSLDGKVAGTRMLAEALGRHYGIESPWNASTAIPREAGRIEIPPLDSLDAIAYAVETAYDITADDAALRQVARADEAGRRAGFDRLRKNYRARREFPAWEVSTASDSQILADLGFRVTIP